MANTADDCDDDRNELSLGEEADPLAKVPAK